MVSSVRRPSLDNCRLHRLQLQRFATLRVLVCDPCYESAAYLLRKRLATRAVHPVWWEAPRPRPVSP